MRRGTRTVLALTAALSALLSLLLGGARAATFSVVALPGPGAGEPGVAIAPDGTIYVNAPRGSGVIWQGRGSSFSRIDNFDRVSLGTGDTDLAVSPDDGTVYAANLSTTGFSNLVYTSRNAGGSYSGPAWAGSDSDRQWLAAGTGGVSYLSYHDLGQLGSQNIWIYRSTNYGSLYVPQGNVTITNPVAYGEALTICGNATDRPHIDPSDPTGNTLYIFFTLGDVVSCSITPPTSQEIAINQVWMARSTDAGMTWSSAMVHGMLTPGGASVTHLLPSADVDAAGNLYVVWSENTGNSNTHVQLMTSGDHGTTWKGPFTVDQEPANHSNVFPSVAAGAPGRIDVAWYSASADNFNDGDAAWIVASARSFDAAAAAPSFAQSQVSNGVVHFGGICQAGLFCTISGGDRNLLDFLDVAIDNSGVANIVWADDNNPDRFLTTYLGSG